jgi:hypothetical protein
MLTVSRARKILGKKYSHLNDEQIDILVSKTHILADIVVNLSENKKFQSQACFIDSNREKKDD